MMTNNFWKEKKVFVTGADGFIGGWVAKTLVEKNAHVVVVVRDMKKSNSLDVHDIKDKVTVVQGDIIDYELMHRIMNEYEIEYVFHLAAQAIVGIANQSPMSTFESNIKGTYTVLEAARNHKKIKGVVVASSDKAYGNQERLPYAEDQPLNGVYPYDASKVCADVLARSYAKSYNLPIAVTRNANTYGGGDMNLSRIIPDAVLSILQDKKLLIRSDGTLERDYMYVKDAAEAYLLLAENLNKPEIWGEAFNFGVGKPLSVLELFREVVRITGKETKIEILGEAKNEINKQYLSIDKAKKILDWKLKYTLEEGLKETMEWYKKYFENINQNE